MNAVKSQTPRADELWVVGHCEERSDAAISLAVRNGMGIASLRSQ
jgi:hypothetical protein